MRNSPDTLAAIREVWNDYASHIIGPDGGCCRGCRLARQIPNLLDDTAELRRENGRLKAELDEAWQGGYKTGQIHAGRAS